jgi:hypothetical protein
MIGDKIIDSLRAHPWALALVVVNVLFLSYIVHEVAASGERRDQLIAELARDCGRAPKGDRQ